MKCQNCGFNSENNAFCPVCGAKMTETSPEPKPQMSTGSEFNPYQQHVNPPINNTQQYTNPYVNQQQNPAFKQPAPPQYNASQQPAPQQYNAPQQPAPGQYNAPQQPAPPQYNASQQPAPAQYNAHRQLSAPQYNAPQHNGQGPQIQNIHSDIRPVSASPKKSKAAAIAITAVIAAIVLAGIIISILSVTLSPKSVFDTPQGAANEDPYAADPYYDDSDQKEFNDHKIHNIGEAFKFDYAEITLKNVEISKKYDNDKCQYAFTVEVKNTTDIYRTYMIDYFDLVESKDEYSNSLNDESLGDRYMEYIYTAGDYSEYDFELEPGESTEFVFYFKGAENYGFVYPEISLSDGSDSFEFSSFTKYSTDLSNLKETNDNP